jgi:hypothetical protein
LIVLLLCGSTAWPSVCERSADCCRKGACPMRMMQTGACHDQHDEATKSVVLHSEHATTVALPSIPMPRASNVTFVQTDAHLLDGDGAAPDHPPRLDSPSC